MTTTEPVSPAAQSAQIEALWRRAREALRRVNQDYAVWGEVERTNATRLADVRREMAHLGLAWTDVRRRGQLAMRPVTTTPFDTFGV